MESLQAQRVFTVREMNISEEMEGEQSLGCCEGWLVWHEEEEVSFCTCFSSTSSVKFSCSGGFKAIDIVSIQSILISCWPQVNNTVVPLYL